MRSQGVGLRGAAWLRINSAEQRTTAGPIKRACVCGHAELALVPMASARHAAVSPIAAVTSVTVTVLSLLLGDRQQTA
jgi:hypothetical protein